MQTTPGSSTLGLEKCSTRAKGASGHHPEPTVQLVSQLPGDKAITTLSKHPSLSCLEIRPGLGRGWGEDRDALQMMQEKSLHKAQDSKPEAESRAQGVPARPPKIPNRTHQQQGMAVTCSWHGSSPGTPETQAKPDVSGMI